MRREDSAFRNRLLIPELVKFQDLFMQWEPYTERGTGHAAPEFSFECPLDNYDSKEGYDQGMRIGTYCSAKLKDRTSYLQVWPTEKVRNLVLNHTIWIAQDYMNFEIIQGNRKGYALVTCHHSVILGSVWVAEITLGSIPNPPAWEQPI